MESLKICILWHQHQPYYRYENEFILPWVRFHAVKDYLDLLLILDEFPTLRQTFNIVPSLLLQIEEYLTKQITDSVQLLTMKKPSELSEVEKKQILRQFFVCNFDNMIKPYKRYYDLYEKAKASNFDINQFNEQDYLDLQVWYNLTWVGAISRDKTQYKRLFAKSQNFTEKEKAMLLEQHFETLREIIPNFKRLLDLEQIEISVSPFYHPILPLICNVEIVKDSDPDITNLNFSFRYAQDANLQVELGKNYFFEKMGIYPKGIWPSEGSVSDEVLKIFIENNFLWTATDSIILKKTQMLSKPSDIYFPYKFSSNEGNIFVFFRDNVLSDSIGFVYYRMNENDAVNDFIGKLHSIRNQIINDYGEESLKYACVPIILDGENCWEFYPNNGLNFLKTLYSRIANEDWISTLTFTQRINSLPTDYNKTIEHIAPGSWINGSFKTWIGHPEKQKAWSILAETRKLLEENISQEDKYNDALKIMLIAEGSDWFWWYGDDNIAPNKDDFDRLFRHYITKIYEELEISPPEYLKFPLGKKSATGSIELPSRRIPKSSAKTPAVESGWGKFIPQITSSTMQTSKLFLESVFFGNTTKHLLLGIKPKRTLSPDELIEIILFTPENISINYADSEISITSVEPKRIGEIFVSFTNYIVVGLSLESLFETKNVYGKEIEFIVRCVSSDFEFTFPQDGRVSFLTI